MLTTGLLKKVKWKNIYVNHWIIIDILMEKYFLYIKISSDKCIFTDTNIEWYCQQLEFQVIGFTKWFVLFVYLFVCFVFFFFCFFCRFFLFLFFFNSFKRILLVKKNISRDLTQGLGIFNSLSLDLRGFNLHNHIFFSISERKRFLCCYVYSEYKWVKKRKQNKTKQKFSSWF